MVITCQHCHANATADITLSPTQFHASDPRFLIDTKGILVWQLILFRTSLITVLWHQNVQAACWQPEVREKSGSQHGWMDGANVSLAVSFLFLKSWNYVITSVHHLSAIYCLFWHALPYSACYFLFLMIDVIGLLSWCFSLLQVLCELQCSYLLSSRQNRTFYTL
jgi:hypothetical protein